LESRSQHQVQVLIMNLRKNLLCCVSSPVCHLVLVTVGTLCVIQLIHTHAHYTMELDTDSYVGNFCRKNPDICESYIRD